MTRIFYVDAARSIQSKEGKKYWKCSVVENGKNLINFANGKAKWSVEAEAYTALSLIYWLIERKYQGKVIINTDLKFLADKKRKLPSKLSNNKGWWNFQKNRSKTKCAYFRELTYELAQKNGIDLIIQWIKGSQNPADHYSRH